MLTWNADFVGCHGQLSTGCLAATNQASILVFSRGKLVKSGQIPFKDCRKLKIYRSYQFPCSKEFVLAVSEQRAALIDFHSLRIVKEWDDVMSVDITDQLSTGQQQVVFTFRGPSPSTYVMRESDWSATSTESLAEKKDETSLQDVIKALSVQSQNARQSLLGIEQQVTMRKLLLNRSATNLREAISLQKPYANPVILLNP